jgi:hypothetical protein
MELIRRGVDCRESTASSKIASQQTTQGGGHGPAIYNLYDIPVTFQNVRLTEISQASAEAKRGTVTADSNQYMSKARPCAPMLSIKAPLAPPSRQEI